MRDTINRPGIEALFSQLPSAAIIQLAQVLAHRADLVLRKHCQLSLTQFKLLLLVKYRQPSISQIDAAGCLQLTPAAVSQLVTALTKTEHLLQTTTPENRRQNCLQLTEGGEHCITIGLKELKNLEIELQTMASQEEVRSCFNTAKKLLLTLRTPQ